MGRINNDTMRDNNINLILNSVRKAGSISRAALAKQLNLTSAAITNIVSHLISKNLLQETGFSHSSLGRRPISISINPAGCRVLGTVISPDRLSVSLADFSCQILETCSRSLNENDSSEDIISYIIDCTQECLQQNGIQMSDILAMGIAAPGPMDANRETLLDLPNFPSLRNTPIRKILSNRLGIPVVLDKDTNAAGLSCYYHNHDWDVNVVFSLFIMTHSIGGSLLSGRSIIHGFSSGVGDIGHTTVDINGPLCRCGRYGCLEAMASGDAIMRKIQSRLKASDTVPPEGISIDSLTLSDVSRLSREGNLMFRRVLGQTADIITVALGNVISILSPEVIRIGGSVIEQCPELIDMIRDRLQRRSYPSYARLIQVTGSDPMRLSLRQGAAMLALVQFQTLLTRDNR